MTPELLLNSKAVKMGFVLQMLCRHWHLHPHIKLETKHPETFYSKHLIFLYWYCTFCFCSLFISQLDSGPTILQVLCKLQEILQNQEHNPKGDKRGLSLLLNSLWVIAVPSGLSTWEAWGRNIWSGGILPWVCFHEPLLIQSNPIPMAGQPLALCSETISGYTAQSGTITVKGF